MDRSRASARFPELLSWKAPDEPHPVRGLYERGAASLELERFSTASV